MTTRSIKMPDVGEGVAEAELVEWNVAIGDIVREDQVIAAVLTDKATVEIPSSVEGKVIWLGGEVGATISVGSELIRIEVEGAGGSGPEAPDEPAKKDAAAERKHRDKQREPATTDQLPKASESAQDSHAAAVAGAKRSPSPPGKSKPFRGSGPLRPEGEKPLAPPPVRSRAKEAGVDLRFVRGTGPANRITHEDLSAFLSGETVPGGGLARDTSVTEIRVLGLRRKIAERMTLANSRIPHITIVEEIDVTQLEDLRAKANSEHAGARGKLTVLPFLMKAMVKALREQPPLNAHYDDEAEIVRQFGAVHIGIATQTRNGLMVAVARHVEAMGLWDTANEVARVTEAARAGHASRDDLSGSTITITSLGALGALATTPIINHPEVAIVGVNRMAIRPWWDGQRFLPRKMMNVSCSFDHRVIDGWDAAVFVQRLKTLLEIPAMIFVES